jgi:hypothetical protein
MSRAEIAGALAAVDEYRDNLEIDRDIHLPSD